MVKIKIKNNTDQQNTMDSNYDNENCQLSVLI